MPVFIFSGSTLNHASGVILLQYIDGFLDAIRCFYYSAWASVFECIVANIILSVSVFISLQCKTVSHYSLHMRTITNVMLLKQLTSLVTCILIIELEKITYDKQR